MRFAFRSGCHVRSGEYFAPIGQIGVHVSLRQQGGRPLNATDVFADGWLHVAIPAFDAHSLSSPRLYVSGSAGSGKGLTRGSISGGPCSPETPISSSASW